MTLNERIEAFSALGTFLRQFEQPISAPDLNIPYNDEFYTQFDTIIKSTIHQNGWFTEENIRYALVQWGNLLTSENLRDWLVPYDLQESELKTIGIVMAGNIPLVGFHDFLCVLITGNKVKAKQSSDDMQLLPLICNYLKKIQPAFDTRIELTKDRLLGIDAVIATGSNNTARYFEYYFRDQPAIIRKNRNSIAILTGNETTEQLKALGEDIFRYYGLGCRSVSKLYVPEGYNFERFFTAIYDYHYLMDSAKYANNYDYNKAVYLMSNFKLLENGFLILKEDTSMSSSIASLFYEYYHDPEQLKRDLEKNQDSLQCIVSDIPAIPSVAFGETQQPSLNDYADGIDVINFLKKINA
ncbi:acyl-CoA reductase [Aquimarina sp. ERC-38]|uniref:acyl-CoA reductase n=1 Tax=Aquimarina sp. ERC-38 TaxID=2949996 RepID=UPI0022462D3A|nr:acyl-CoA reductase [Aquimarina sp. ERC-38]UZO79694.1 acyl-CoA reductase [Aquimarina sp. ERC-38]